MNTIGERIGQIITKNGLKKVEFARKLGIDQSYVTKLLKGEKFKPSDALILSICREFGVSETWLRTGEGEMRLQPDTVSLDELVAREGLRGAEAEMVKKLVRIYCSLKAATRQDIMARFNEYFGGQIIRDISAPVRPERNVHDWTDEEILEEVRSQLDAEKEETGESSTSCSGNSGAAIA